MELSAHGATKGASAAETPMVARNSTRSAEVPPTSFTGARLSRRTSAGYQKQSLGKGGSSLISHHLV